VARKRRVFVEGAVYHVYNRVASGEEIFADAEEAITFLDLVRRIKSRDGWTVFAWCIMSNHYHLAVRTSAIRLSRGMHHLQCTYSRGFNRRRRRTGALWQSRYQARLVDEQEYLSRVILYIHLNPVRARIVDDAKDFVFSGHRELLKRSSDPLIDVDDALLCFGETRRAARHAYRSAIEAGASGEDGGGLGARGGLRGLSWFDSELEPRPGQAYVDMMGRSTGRERGRLTAHEFVEATCRLLDVDMEVIASRARDRASAESRRIIATLGVERWGQSGRELAEVLNKNSDVVSWWVGEGVRRRIGEPSFSELLDELDERLDRETRKARTKRRRPESSGHLATS